MARIVLTTFGSYGDLHPYLAVGTELLARGHAVTLATHGSYRDAAGTAGLQFHPVPPDMADFGDLPETMRRSMDLRRGSEYVFRALVLPFLPRTRDALLEACRGADLVVDHALTVTAPLVAEKLGIPRVRAALQPFVMFSAFDPPVSPAIPGSEWLLGAGPLVWRTLFAFGRRLSAAWLAPVMRLRAEMGLPPSGVNLIFDGWSPVLNLALFSSVMAPPRPDWPARTVQTGFPFWRGAGHDALPPALEAWLARGEAPVVFTLGSSAIHDAGSFYSDAARACARLGLRAVLLTGREGANPVPAALLNERIAAFEYAPFAPLFPRSAAVVHQGGIGTTGEALASGRPMIVVPHSHDQPDNAARCARLGLARVITRKKWSEAALGRELAGLLADARARARADEVGARVRAEGGVGAAADAIESVLAGR